MTSSPPHIDFPTRVGMARQSGCNRREKDRFPHPRGDGPESFPAASLPVSISPPAWGWPVGAEGTIRCLNDFPTRVGMARSCVECFLECFGFPHPRGDGPCSRSNAATSAVISPPAWGWPVFTAQLPSFLRDFPTRVGMARSIPFLFPAPSRFPHPRGDGPLRLCG